MKLGFCGGGHLRALPCYSTELWCVVCWGTRLVEVQPCLLADDAPGTLTSRQGLWPSCPRQRKSGARPASTPLTTISWTSSRRAPCSPLGRLWWQRLSVSGFAWLLMLHAACYAMRNGLQMYAEGSTSEDSGERIGFEFATLTCLLQSSSAALATASAQQPSTCS